jgi:uncharacterized protein YcbK (DUF882 family)
MGWMRRTVLLGAACGLATLLIPGRPDAQAARRITLRHASTGARFSGVWHDGRRPDPRAMAELSAALADADCPTRAFDADAIAIAWELGLRARLAELTIHSGFRTPQVNRAVHGAGDSFHLQASALDIGTTDVAALGAEALKLGRGGVGIYAGRGFIHVDSGPVRQWGEGSAGGRPRASLFTARGLELQRGAQWIRRPSAGR